MMDHMDAANAPQGAEVPAGGHVDVSYALLMAMLSAREGFDRIASLVDAICIADDVADFDKEKMAAIRREAANAFGAAMQDVATLALAGRGE